jgi:hypothetical protein
VTNRSAYDLTVDGEQHIAFVVDTGHETCRSVTNDAENVVADLVRLGIDVDRYRIIYRDSGGTWDGIDTEDGRFAGFYALRATNRTEAAFMALTRRTRAQLATGVRPK